MIDGMLSSLYIIVVVLVISASLLAFVVIYNLNNINISERKRELATIKLLGFYDSEVAMYVYRENIWLTLIGAFAGIFIGRYFMDLSSRQYRLIRSCLDLIFLCQAIYTVWY